jgi:hypothetical protein
MEMDLVSSRVDMIVDIIRHATFTPSCLRHAGGCVFCIHWLDVKFCGMCAHLASMAAYGYGGAGNSHPRAGCNVLWRHSWCV